MKENIKQDSASDLFKGILKTARDAGALQERHQNGVSELWNSDNFVGSGS